MVLSRVEGLTTLSQPVESLKVERVQGPITMTEIQNPKLRYDINPASKLVIPAAAERRAGIQKKPCYYWIPAFAGMTE